MFFIRLLSIILTASTAMAAMNTTGDLTRLRAIGLPSETSIYVFTSVECPHCADFHQNILPEIVKKYAKSGRAQILLVDSASSSSPDATKASMLARCLPADKSEKFMAHVFNHQSEWVRQKDATEKLTRYAVTAGLTQNEAKKCLSDFNLKSAISDQWNNLAKLYHVLYLPTVAVRRGNIVRTYTGANKDAVLNGMEHDFQ